MVFGGIVAILLVVAVIGAAMNVRNEVPATVRETSGSVTNVATEHQAPAMSFDETNWGLLATDPDKYEGAHVDIIGKVFIAPERTTDAVAWQMWASPNDSEWNTLVKIDDPNFQIEDGDYVRVVGTVAGSYEGQNLMGGTVQAVVILAEIAEVVDALAAAPPALRVAEVNQAIDQHGLVITLVKVEYAAKETRVHLVVRNNSISEASFYAFNAKAVQGSTQFESESRFDSYPEVQSSLLPHVESSGIIVFPAMDPFVTAAFYLQGRTDDFSLDFTNYIFEVVAQQ
jgi:hypothetical protein